MNLATPQSDTTCRSINRTPRLGARLRPLWQRSKISRLRRRGPRWLLAALLLLAADFVLAIVVWLIIEHIARYKVCDAGVRHQKHTNQLGSLANEKTCDSDEHTLQKSEAMRGESDS